jgi:glycosyltransferase involved in cell wall biosynthesis
MKDYKKKILYIAPHFSSFVKEDIALLSNDFIVSVYINNWFNKYKVPLNFLNQILYCFKVVHSHNILVISFAGYWSYFPCLIFKLFNKKVFIILNGTDSCAIPSMKYGNLRSFLHRIFVKKSIKNCDLLLPVSESLIKTQITFSILPDPEKKQGVYHFFKDIKTPYKVIPNAINSIFWKNLNKPRIKNSFITVFSEKQFYLKGGDLILEFAKKNPSFQFFIAGCNLKNEDTPQNVQYLGFVSKDELLEKYNICEYYFQLSTFEGFGCSLSEAILCGCIPIGSNANAIPEIINNPNLILDNKNITDLSKLINQLIVSPLNEFDKRKLIEHIQNEYSIDNRLNLFNKVIK